MTIVTIILIITVIVLIIAYNQQRKQVASKNFEIERENRDLETRNLDLKAIASSLEKQRTSLENELQEGNNELQNIKITVQAQQNILSSLRTSSEIMREEAQSRAQEVYEARLAALDSQLAQVRIEKEEEFQKDLSELMVRVEEQEKEASDSYRLLMGELEKKRDEIKSAETALANLEAKQLAYIQAHQRELEAESKRDYYRLIISGEDLREAKALRELQVGFNRKDAIDKLIWETYYRPAYDALMPHIFDNRTKVSGIYKITNIETGQPYIGQSVDVRERMRQHIKASLAYSTPTNKLYQQMKKYGPENFTFELLEEIPRVKLDEREKYWIEFYKAKEFGLNGQKGNG